MSRSYPGEQVEHAFNSKRLKNWEVPAVDKSQVRLLKLLRRDMKVTCQQDNEGFYGRRKTIILPPSSSDGMRLHLLGSFLASLGFWGLSRSL